MRPRPLASLGLLVLVLCCSRTNAGTARGAGAGAGAAAVAQPAATPAEPGHVAIATFAGGGRDRRLSQLWGNSGDTGH
jgi:hypothetical protein